MSSVREIRRVYGGLAALAFERDKSLDVVSRLLLHLLFVCKGGTAAARALRIGDHRRADITRVLVGAGLVTAGRHGQLNLTRDGAARCVEILSPWINAFSQDAKPVKSLF